MMALAHLGGSDLIAALPRRLFQHHGARFGLVGAELPLKRKPDPIHAITTKVALMDSGVSWLMEVVAESTKDYPTSRIRTRRGSGRLDSSED